MNHHFDSLLERSCSLIFWRQPAALSRGEFTKGLARSVTRRAALRKFGLGVAGMALAYFGLANRSSAAPDKVPNWCDRSTNFCCCKHCKTYFPTSDMNWVACNAACGSLIGQHCP
jgi:hypothetical protein